MALPPWLNISPSQYLSAVEAGTRAGLSIRQASEAAWEHAQRMEMDQEKALAAQKQLGIENAQTRLAQDRLEAYRQGELKNAAARIGVSDASEKAMQAFREAQAAETGRHNLATEQAAAGKLERGAGLITHPELPGYTFLRNPSGAESVVSRPERDLEKMKLQIQAQNMFKLGANELSSDPSYGSRTNLAGNILRSLTPASAPVAAQSGTPASVVQDAPPAPTDVKSRKANTTYKTPKGVFLWTGKGWAKPTPPTGSIPISPVSAGPQPEPDDNGE